MKKQDHFIIWNFKSWRIKSGLIFSFRAILQSLRPFSISRPIFKKIAKKGSKWLKFEKIRPLLFLQLLKFHNIKWTYFFNLRPFWPFFGHFLIFVYIHYILIIAPSSAYKSFKVPPLKTSLNPPEKSNFFLGHSLGHK